jgi:acyl-CoA thioesterase
VQVDFDPGWLGMEAVFGGTVLAAVADAAVLDGFHAQSLTATFVSAVRPGPAAIRTEVLHRGRSTASVRLVLVQEDRPRVLATASLVPPGGRMVWDPSVDVSGAGDPVHAPVLVPRHRPLPYAERLELRQVGEDSLSGGSTAWVRMRAGEDHGLGAHGRVALYLDVLAPGLFSQPVPPRFVPSIEFSAHFSPRAAGAVDPAEWFLVTNTTVWSTDSYCVDESELRDRDGRLVAQVRQGRAVRW